MSVRDLASRLSDLVNPIVIKELRQAVRGRFVVTLVILSLIAQMIAVIGAMIGQRIESTNIERAPAGPMLFETIYVVLLFGSFILIPMYAGIRMMSEHSDSNVDLLFITTIRPRNVVAGKILSSAVLTALIFSAAIPFLMFSYVLRGIDFIGIIYVTACGILLVVSQSILALFIGALPASRPFKILLALVVFAVSLGGAVATNVMALSAVRVRMTFSHGSPWHDLLALMAIIACLDVLLVFLTVALVSPPSANRALPLRMLLTALWLITLGLAVWTMLGSGSSDVMLVWAAVSCGLQALVLFSAIGEREEWGPRVARTIPHAPVMRAAAFLFYSGGGGTLWAIAMMAATIAVYGAATPFFINSAKVSDGATWLFDGCACVIGYAGSALWMRRTRLATRVPQRHTWAIVLGLFILLAVVPPLTALAVDSNGPQVSTVIQMTTLANPFPTTSPPHTWLGRTLILGAWAAVVCAGNLPWITGLFRRFR